jgi:hypothetical protein
MLALWYLSYQNPAYFDEEFTCGVRCELPTTDHPSCGMFHSVDWRKFFDRHTFGTSVCTNSPDILTASLISKVHRWWSEVSFSRNYYCVVALQGTLYVKELGMCFVYTTLQAKNKQWISCFTITIELKLHQFDFVCRTFKFASCLAQHVNVSI